MCRFVEQKSFTVENRRQRRAAQSRNIFERSSVKFSGSLRTLFLMKLNQFEMKAIDLSINSKFKTQEGKTKNQNTSNEFLGVS